ncbi:MAG: hypothetical protein AB7O43_01675 [Hyphomicrobiaceae bacterium]
MNGHLPVHAQADDRGHTAGPQTQACAVEAAPLDFDTVEARIDAIAETALTSAADAVSRVSELLELGETVLERWIEARGEQPTKETREGFRLLALHRQGAKGEPSFNACRESCRELAYHYNLVTLEPEHPALESRVHMAALVTKHLLLFVSGKMQVAGLGEFCCSSKPVRLSGS